MKIGKSEEALLAFQDSEKKGKLVSVKEGRHIHMSPLSRL